MQYNPYHHIEYFAFPNKFAVKILNKPVRYMTDSFDTLAAAMAARDEHFQTCPATNPDFTEMETNE